MPCHRRYRSPSGGAAAVLRRVGGGHVRGHEDHDRDVRRLLQRSARVAVGVLLREAVEGVLREERQGETKKKNKTKERQRHEDTDKIDK